MGVQIAHVERVRGEFVDELVVRQRIETHEAR
jgi:hypothetical protein